MSERALLLSEVSAPHIARYQKSLPQALLLSGQRGVGLYTIAHFIAKQHGDDILVQPELLTKTSTVPQIGIDKIRELYDQTRTRLSKGRVVIIDDADTMTVPAQNAFLKLLEEPNASTRFILTSHHAEALLPTIRSRLEQHHIVPLSKEQTKAQIDSYVGLTAQKRSQLLFIAEGLPAELDRLIDDDMLFREKASLIGMAKKLIEAPAYERVVIVNKEKLTRHSVDVLCEQIIELLSRAPSPQGVKQIEHLLSARERIAHGGNIKLQLLAAIV